VKRLGPHKLSQNCVERRYSIVDAMRESIVEAGVETDANEARPDLETIFAIHYGRIARVIAKVIRDPARAEELAVEVFLRWSRNHNAQGEGAEGWLHRTALRAGLDELRRVTRRARYEALVSFFRATPTPEEIRSSEEERERVRLVLACLPPQQAALLLLRSDGLSYDELASTLELNPASVGTLLSRAQQAFRKEYLKRYGKK
jgi:RNA polymerase sigma-70 factor (ECF subfamily)